MSDPSTMDELAAVLFAEELEHVTRERPAYDEPALFACAVTAMLLRATKIVAGYDRRLELITADDARVFGRAVLDELDRRVPEFHAMPRTRALFDALDEACAIQPTNERPLAVVVELGKGDN